MDIVENLLQTIYVLPFMADVIKKSYAATGKKQLNKICSICEICG